VVKEWRNKGEGTVLTRRWGRKEGRRGMMVGWTNKRDFKAVRENGGLEIWNRRGNEREGRNYFSCCL
jgi:hypothetical protein